MQTVTGRSLVGPASGGEWQGCREGMVTGSWRWWVLTKDACLHMPCDRQDGPSVCTRDTMALPGRCVSSWHR
jgi:hypothetical protein